MEKHTNLHHQALFFSREHRLIFQDAAKDVPVPAPEAADAGVDAAPVGVDDPSTDAADAGEGRENAADAAAKKEQASVDKVTEKFGVNKEELHENAREMGKTLGELLKIVQEFMQELRNAMGVISPEASGIGESAPRGDKPPREKEQAQTISNPELLKEIQKRGLTAMRTDIDNEEAGLNEQLTNPTTGLNAKMGALNTRESTIRNQMDTINSRLQESPAPNAAERVRLEGELASRKTLLAATESAIQALQGEIDRVKAAIAQIPERRKQIDTTEEEASEMKKNIDNTMIAARDKLQAMGSPVATDLADIYNDIVIQINADTLQFSMSPLFGNEPLSASITRLSHTVSMPIPSKEEMGIKNVNGVESIQNEGAFISTIKKLSNAVIAHEKGNESKTKEVLENGKTLLRTMEGVRTTTADTYAFDKDGVSTSFQFTNGEWQWNGASGNSVPVPQDQFLVEGTDAEKAAKNEVNTLAEQLEKLK